MADIGLGGAWVDVGLRFAEFEKGLKEAERRARSGAKKIEESFMVRFTSGFVEKAQAATNEKILARAFAAKQKYAAEDAATAQKRIEDQRALNSSLSAAAKIDAERLRIMLGENEAMDDQVRKAVQLTNLSKQANQMMAGIRGVPMAGSAAAFGRGGTGNSQSAINQRAMNMAQLSYAIQDFATGMAMGNFNMAVMGASNNLGMMAQSIGPLAGGLTVIAASLLPHAIDAIDKLSGIAERASGQVLFLKRAFDEFRDSAARQTKVMSTVFDIEGMEGAGAAEAGVDRLRKMNNERKIAAKLEEDRVAEITRLKASIKGVGIEQGMGFRFLDWIAGTGGPPQGVSRKMTQDAILQVLESVKKLEQARKDAQKDEIDRNQEEIAMKSKLIELQDEYAKRVRSDLTIATGSPLAAANERAFRELTDRLKDINKNAPPEQRESLSDQARRAYREQRQQNEENDKAAKRRLDLEMKPFATPAQHARLRAQEEYERNVANLRKLYKNDPQELAKQEAAAKNKLSEDNKKIDQDEARDKRHLQAQLTAEIDKEAGQRMAIQNRLKDQIDEINRMGGLSDADRKQMIDMARRGAQKQLADIGPRGQFAGIADLAKSVQQGMSSQSQDLRVSAEYLHEILEQLKDMNLGAGP